MVLASLFNYCCIVTEQQFCGKLFSELQLIYGFSSGNFSRRKELICGALRDLVLFVQFKKGRKHPRRSVNILR